MEPKLLKVLTVLGVPGVALGVFYLLLRMFDFRFSAIDPTWSAVTAIVFLLVVAAVTAFALHRWSPKTSTEKVSHSKTGGNEREAFKYTVEKETVTYEEKFRSTSMDVVKVNTHSHGIGVNAEYAWLKHHYPGCNVKSQGVATLDGIIGTGDYDFSQLHFDVIQIHLKGGQKKEIYFDISSFYGGSVVPKIDPHDFAARKISELYSSRTGKEA